MAKITMHDINKLRALAEGKDASVPGIAGSLRAREEIQMLPCERADYEDDATYELAKNLKSFR